MKKNRPAYQLNVLCEKSDISRLEQIIFSQTTTIGIRRQRMERSILPRKTETLNTIYGNIQVKICEIESCKRIYPEYESVIQICQQTGQAFRKHIGNFWNSAINNVCNVPAVCTTTQLSDSSASLL